MPTLTIQITEHVYRGMQIVNQFSMIVLISIEEVHMYGVGCTELLQELKYLPTTAMVLTLRLLHRVDSITVIAPLVLHSLNPAEYTVWY